MNFFPPTDDAPPLPLAPPLAPPAGVCEVEDEDPEEPEGAGVYDVDPDAVPSRDFTTESRSKVNTLSQNRSSNFASK